MGDGLVSGWLSAPYRHLHGVRDQLGAHVIGDRPADDSAGPGVDDDGEVHLAGSGGVFGDVHDPQTVRALGVEAPVDQVVVDGSVPGSGAATAFAVVDALSAADSHQAGDGGP